MYSQTQFVRKFFNQFNYVILACFLTPLFYIFILHILLLLCFIFILMENFYLHFWLDNDRSSVEKSGAVFPLDFTSHCFQKHLLVSTYYFLQKGKILCSLEQNYNRFYTCFHTGRESVLPVTPYVTYLKKRIFRATLFPGSLCLLPS